MKSKVRPRKRTGDSYSSPTLVLLECLSHSGNRSDADMLLNRNVSFRVQKILPFP